MLIFFVGFYTGDIYGSALNKRDGWAGEHRSDKYTFSVKTHLKPYDKGQPLYSRAILLIRNVADSVLAEFNREYAGPIGRVKESVYLTKSEYFILNFYSSLM